MSNRLYPLLPRITAGARLTGAHKYFWTTAFPLERSPPPPIESSEIEAADPFLSKLQQQTEASYLELLSRKEDVPDTEDDASIEEEEVLVCQFVLGLSSKLPGTDT